MLWWLQRSHAQAGLYARAACSSVRQRACLDSGNGKKSLFLTSCTHKDTYTYTYTHTREQMPASTAATTLFLTSHTHTHTHTHEQAYLNIGDYFFDRLPSGLCVCVCVCVCFDVATASSTGSSGPRQTSTTKWREMSRSKLLLCIIWRPLTKWPSLPLILRCV